MSDVWGNTRQPDRREISAEGTEEPPGQRRCAKIAPMADAPLLRENVRLRALLLAFVLAGLGVLALWWPFNPWWPLASDSAPRAIAFGVGPALLSVAALGLGYEMVLRRAVHREALDAAHLTEDMARTGVLEIGRFDQIDFLDYFRGNSGDVDLCFSYAKSWAALNAENLLRQKSDGKTRIRITLLDPQPDPGDEYFDAYVERYGCEDRDELRSRIDEAVNTWRQAAKVVQQSGREVNLTIEGIRSLVPYTFYRSGDSMWVVMHPWRRERVGSGIPALRCAKVGDAGVGIYDWVLDDLEQCREQGVTREVYVVPEGEE